MDESNESYIDTETFKPAKKSKQPNWDLTEARLADLHKAREKAAALRREIRATKEPKAKVVRPTKLEPELENIRLKEHAAEKPSK